ncbi:MAG: hypothetical protein J6R29_04165 [Clostridia bacterium]|nr:hypothetical protein [Clostridia bacterium]
MRYATIFGINDKVYIKIDDGESFVKKLMEIGECETDLIYKAKLTGAELLKEFKLSKEHAKLISLNNLYEITAYDW